MSDTEKYKIWHQFKIENDDCYLSTFRDCMNSDQFRSLVMSESNYLAKSEFSGKIVMTENLNEKIFSIENPELELHYNNHQIIMEWYYKSRENIVFQVLSKLLNRIPSEDDFEKVEFRSTDPEISHFFFEGVYLGQIKVDYPTAPLNQDDSFEKLGITFIPSDQFK